MFVCSIYKFNMFVCKVWYVCVLYVCSGARQSKSNVAHDEPDPVSILHPEAIRAESIIRNAWADVRLVAD